jgi:hypothetical protein
MLFPLVRPWENVEFAFSEGYEQRQPPPELYFETNGEHTLTVG